MKIQTQFDFSSCVSGEDPRLEELTYELTELLEKAEGFDLESFVQQHPLYADELRRLYPAIRAMVNLACVESATPADLGMQNEGSTVCLGDYRLVRQVGQGGMGVVFEAEQMSLLRTVAVKILPFASLWPESVLTRFVNEVRIAASLEHPHIVPIYGVGCERGVNFYAMKLIDGCSLADVIRRRESFASSSQPSAKENLQLDAGTTKSLELLPTQAISQTTPYAGQDSSVPNSTNAQPSTSDAARIDAVVTEVIGNDDWHRAAANLALSAAEALAYAHERGVIHRDIKPSNLLLDSQGKLFVADFGLARADTDLNLTRTGELLGTPRYMSPEQAAGRQGAVDVRTDIYSLGATLYELITLQPVVRAVNRAASLHELQHLHVNPPRQHDANIPQPLEQIVLKCLQPDPRDRYRSADDLADDEQGATVTADGRSLLFARSTTSNVYFGIFEATRASKVDSFGNATSVWSELNSVPKPVHPDISDDGRTLLFSDDGGSGLYKATRSETTGPFSDVQSLDILPNQRGNGPSLSADGLTLFFAAYDTSNTQNDIYQATRLSTSDPWESENVIKLGSEINTSGYNDAQPSSSSDGLMLFFNSNRPGGFGDHDLYMAIRPSVDAEWGNTMNLGPQVNTPYVDQLPFVFADADGSMLFFHSTRPGGWGGRDIYQVPILGTPGDTKFYVVDDATIDRTYEYQADGIAIDGYQLALGNTQPRGAASTSAGDKVWVVDANKEVYVYNEAGGLLGSWTANSLANNATIEGIATNGTDVWIVDARQDRVYRYANAASRLSGSQSATSSFALNSGNRSPKDIVTDGVNLWVVNDITTDKVFKYTVSGSLVGSWTINAGGGKPTGITLDPSGGSQSLWIVDSASDRVYEYANSRAKNSGSQSAAASFALAAGNTNPQGIADPPPQLAPSAALSSSITLDSRPTSNPSAPILHLGWNSPATTRR